MVEDKNMDAAYQAAGQVLAAQKDMDALLAKQFGDLKELKPLVVPGQHDHIERILTAMQIPYESKNLLDLSTLPPLHNRPIFVNCGSINNPPRSLTERLKDHVSQGGTLITTDWALGLVNAIFPEYIAWNNLSTAGHNESFAIDRENPKPEDPTLSWFVECSSHPLALPMHEDVKVILASSEFGKKYGGNPALGVSFPYGKGGVIHYVSHLYAQMVALHKDQDTAASTVWAKEKGANLGDLGAQTTTGSVATAYHTITEVLSGATSKWNPTAATQSRTYTATAIPDVQTPLRANAPFCIRGKGKFELERFIESLAGNYTIGRTSEVDLQIPDSQVSRYHARLEPNQELVHIKDLQSHNGTYVNGQVITSPTQLYYGDTIKIGQTELKILPAA